MAFLALSGNNLDVHRHLILCLMTSVFLFVSSYSCVHGEESKTYSRKEAYQASGEWDMETFEVKNPKIVLYYGDGFKFAQNTAQVMREKSYPAVAYSGGPIGKVEVIVGTISVGTYDQRALHKGTVAGDASDAYDARFGKPSEEILSISNIK